MSNNTSGFPGVYWNGKSKKWAAQARCLDTSHHLGFFADKNDAAQAVARFYRSNGFTERHIGQ